MTITYTVNGMVTLDNENVSEETGFNRRIINESPGTGESIKEFIGQDPEEK